MGEEAKQNSQPQAEKKDKKPASEVVKTVLKFILGIVFVAVGIFLAVHWWTHLRDLIKGCAGLFLVLVGLITIAIAKD